MKKLLQIILVTVLTISFTSCVENEIPAEVEAVYNSQADLLASQAALLDAQSAIAASEAVRNAAQTAFLEAQAKAEDARAAMAEAEAAIAQAMAEAEIAAMIAQTAIDQATSAAGIAAAEAAAAQAKAESDARIAAMIAAMNRANNEAAAQLALDEVAAQNAAFQLQQAQEQWAAQMATMARNIAAAEAAAANAAEIATAQAIASAFNDYILAKNNMDNLINEEAGAQLDLLRRFRWLAQDAITDEAALNSLIADVTAEEAQLAVMQGMLADYQAMLEPGTTIGDRLALREAYQTQIEENEILMHDKLIEVFQTQDARTDAQIALAATGYYQEELRFSVLQGQYTNARADAETARGNSAALNVTAKSIADDVAELQDIVDNYDTKLADLEAVITAAKAARGAANRARKASLEVKDDAIAAASEATDAVTDAQAALVAVEAAEAAALAELQAAVTAYSAALAAVTDTTALEADVTTTADAIPVAEAAYFAAKSVYEADPTGTTWLDGGVDARLGKHDDDGMSVETFVEILSVSGPVGPNQTATFGATIYTTQADVITAGGTVSANAYRNFTAADEAGDVYFNIEADDVMPIGNNAQVLNNRATALAAAKQAAENAVVALAAAVAANDVSVELAAYNEATAFYETAQAQVTAAQAAVTAAENAKDAADEAVDAATIAHAANIKTHKDAKDAVTAAEGDLSVFNNSTEVDYQNMLEGRLVDQNVNANAIALADADFIMFDTLAKEIAAKIDAGPAYSAEQLAALEIFRNLQDLYNQLYFVEYFGLSDEITLLNNYVNLIDISESISIEGMISNLEADIVVQESAIAAAQLAVDNFTTNVAFSLSIIENIEAHIADVQRRIETQQLVVDQMKAILDNLL